MEHQRRRDTLTVYLKGELDHCSAQGVRRELDAMLTDSRVKHLILDMGELSFMDSSGIGVVIGRYRALAARGGDVSVKNMNPHVQRIFSLSGMGQIIQSI